jgi:hypothetical protein
MKKVYIILSIVLLSNFSFGQEANKAHQKNNVHEVICTEVIQTGNYTYLQVNEKDNLIWVAVPKMEAQKGETYYFIGSGMEMGPFKSKELDRTFDQLLFLGAITKKTNSEKTEETTHKAEVEINKEDIKIEASDGCISIKELYANKEKYANKEVTVKGKVTKFSKKIMSRNWIHLQDGTNHEGDFDLTITTNEEVNIDDIVVITGKLTLDKDFGYGYFYKLIIEEGKVIK